MPRDIEYEQIDESSNAELADRQAALEERYDPRPERVSPMLRMLLRGYPMAQLRELHLIRDERHRRELK